MAVTDNLRSLVIAKLRWPESMVSDTSALLRLDEEIEAGKLHLARVCDLPAGFDWDAEGAAEMRTLLWNYVLYDESDALDEFDANFADLIQQHREHFFMPELSALLDARESGGSDDD